MKIEKKECTQFPYPAYIVKDQREKEKPCWDVSDRITADYSFQCGKFLWIYSLQKVFLESSNPFSLFFIVWSEIYY